MILQAYIQYTAPYSTKRKGRGRSGRFFTELYVRDLVTRRAAFKAVQAAVYAVFGPFAGCLPLKKERPYSPHGLGAAAASWRSLS